MSLKDKIIDNEKLLISFGVRDSTLNIEALISKDFKQVGVPGALVGFSDLLNNPQKKRIGSCNSQDWEFRVLNDGIAQTLYNAISVQFDNRMIMYTKHNSIWRCEDDIWKIVYHQSTQTSAFDLNE